MPPEAESRDPSEWFQKGREDLDRVPRRIEEGDCEDAAFHLQQALEKYLKGFLIAKGWQLRRTHNLSLLLDEAASFLPVLEAYRTLCEEASAFYVEERYPLSSQAPSQEELEASFQKARALVDLLVSESGRHPG